MGGELSCGEGEAALRYWSWCWGEGRGGETPRLRWQGLRRGEGGAGGDRGYKQRFN